MRDRAARGHDGHVSARIAVVEPYLGGSHRAWAEGYAEHSQHEVEVFGLPAVHWKWRMQGGHVSLAPQIEAAVAQRGPFDAVFASSMTNLPGLLGLCRGALAGARVALYLHENQLTFPWSERDRPDLTYPMINWTSMVAADVVVWNSAYHRDEWFDALPGFLARFPDRSHADLIGAVRARSIVEPVGIDLAALNAIEPNRRPRPLVLWNQRWEYDKGPAEFAAAITALIADGCDFDVALAGERFTDEPPEFVVLRSALGDRLVHDGYADTETYRRLLRSADVVASTAHHEFFGIAVAEAIHAGSFPVLPRRLVYPERIPDHLRDRCLYDTADDLVEHLRWAIEHRDDAVAVARDLRPAVEPFDWSSVAPRYDEMLVGGRRAR